MIFRSWTWAPTHDTSIRGIVTTTESHRRRLYHLGVAAPTRSTLADANAIRPPSVFAELFSALLKQAHRSLRKASSDAVRLIDSSRITLNSLSRDWAHYDATCDGIKLHVVYDPRAALPVHFAVSPARDNDMVQAKGMPVEPGATYVFCLGYYSFFWWGRLDAAGCRFVTRLSKTSPAEMIEEQTVSMDGPISPIASCASAIACSTPASIPSRGGTCARYMSSSRRARHCGS